MSPSCAKQPHRFRDTYGRMEERDVERASERGAALSPMSKARATVEIFAGFGLLLLGVIGGLLPVIQGWVFTLAGLWILGRHFRWPKRMLVWVRRRLRRRRTAGPPVSS